MAQAGRGGSNRSMTDDDTQVYPFQPQVSDAAVQDLRDRLARTRWPDELPDAPAWELGCDRATLQRLCAAWQAFDVQGFFGRLAAWPHCTTRIDGETLHFVHRRSSRPDALPLLVTHGWPGSVWEFHRLLDALAEPSDPALPAYHVVCPSIPGYGFSGPTHQRGWSVVRVARALAELMRRLGYLRYGAQGGDWGAIITAHLAAHDPAHCAAVHLNMVVAGPPDPKQPMAGVQPDEVADVQAMGWFRTHGFAYQDIQKTKPQSLAYGLTDSPAGLAGWVLEKFHAWGDLAPAGGDVLARFGLDTLCANLSIYCFTGTINASMRLYYESIGPGRGSAIPRLPVPTACAVFAKDIFRPPRAWADAQYPHIVRWTRFAQGGHFAALEEPEALLADLRAFFTADRFQPRTP
jgi:pimeloyl-ACP methyl ester carboxylesterase